MNWQREADGMIVHQAGAGTLTVLTITNQEETWNVGSQDGIGWFKNDDGSIDILMRATLAVAFGEYDIVASFGHGMWQLVRWLADDGTEAEAHP